MKRKDENKTKFTEGDARLFAKGCGKKKVYHADNQ